MTVLDIPLCDRYRFTRLPRKIRKPSAGKGRPSRIRPLVLKAAIVVPLIVALVAPAMGLTVYDPSNHAENVLQAARALKQLEAATEQIRNQVQSLINDAKNLAKLPSSIVGDIQDTIERSKELLRETKGLSFELERVRQEFDALYPESHSASAAVEEISKLARQRETKSRESVRTAMEYEAEVASALGKEAELAAKILKRSEEATGALSAAQAGTEAATHTNTLLAKIIGLLAAQGRMQAHEIARELAEIEDIRATREKVLGRRNTASTGD